MENVYLHSENFSGKKRLLFLVREWFVTNISIHHGIFPARSFAMVGPIGFLTFYGAVERVFTPFTPVEVDFSGFGFETGDAVSCGVEESLWRWSFKLS